MREVDLGAPALIAVLTIGLVSGAASVWFLQRRTDRAKVRAAAGRIVAHLLEFRLFADEPALILKAQWDLIAANGRLLRLLLVPTVFLVLPFWALVAVSDGVFGRAPLQPGEPAVVTIQCRAGQDTIADGIRLVAPGGVAVETPPVRIPADGQVSWRIRAIAPVSGALQIQYGGRSLMKTISAGGGLRVASEVRAGTLWSLLLHPLEVPFSDANITSITVQYPPAAVFDTHWLVWFSLSSLVGAVIALIVR